MTTDFALIETELLLAKYGADRVLKAIAVAEGRSVDELRKLVADLRVKRPAAKHKRTELGGFVAKICTENPEKAEILGRIYAAFCNRTIFTDYRDIEEFLARYDGRKHAFRTRNDGARALFSLLATLGAEKLERIWADARSSEQGDLHTLAQGILNRKG